MPDLIECPTCRRMFPDTDDTGVCPQGHETRGLVDHDDEWPVGEVVG